MFPMFPTFFILKRRECNDFWCDMWYALQDDTELQCAAVEQKRKNTLKNESYWTKKRQDASAVWYIHI
jgi:hypothetical protein